MVSTTTSVVDIVAWSLYGAAILVYHSYLFLSAKSRRLNIALSVMLINNPAWTAKMIRTKGSEILSVQSLRNTIIAATFVGGFAFTTATTYIAQLETTDTSSFDARQARSTVLAVALYLAFLNFALVVRTAAHLGYLLGSATGQLDAVDFPAARRTVTHHVVLPVENQPQQSPSTQSAQRTTGDGTVVAARAHTPDMIARQVTLEAGRRVEPPLQALEAADVATRCKQMIVLMSFHFSLGFRCFYCAIPVAMYAAGPAAFIAATAVITLWLLYIDHACQTS